MLQGPARDLLETQYRLICNMFLSYQRLAINMLKICWTLARNILETLQNHVRDSTEESKLYEMFKTN